MYDTEHISVLLNESLDALNIKKNAKYIDATLGAGGHSIEIVKRGGNVLGIDQDQKMIEVANKNLELACPPDKNFVGSFTLAYANFKDLDIVARKNDFSEVDGILMDLGVSSLHFDSAHKGFSFSDPQDLLDMRLDENLGVTAADLLNSLDQNSLVELFRLGECENSKSLSRKVIEYRGQKKFENVRDLLNIFPKKIPGKNHPATKAMMALRIAVNSEYVVLKESLPKAVSLLVPNGRLVVISFHSGEDRIVKHVFNDLENKNFGQVLTKKPIVPSELEIDKNPRARSAKMRVFQKNEVYKQKETTEDRRD